MIEKCITDRCGGKYCNNRKCGCDTLGRSIAVLGFYGILTGVILFILSSFIDTECPIAALSVILSAVGLLIMIMGFSSEDSTLDERFLSHGYNKVLHRRMKMNEVLEHMVSVVTKPRSLRLLERLLEKAEIEYIVDRTEENKKKRDDIAEVVSKANAHHGSKLNGLFSTTDTKHDLVVSLARLRQSGAISDEDVEKVLKHV